MASAPQGACGTAEAGTTSHPTVGVEAGGVCRPSASMDVLTLEASPLHCAQFPKNGLLSETVTVSSRAEQRRLKLRLGAEVESKGSRGIWRHDGFERQPPAGQGEGRSDLARGMRS